MSPATDQNINARVRFPRALQSIALRDKAMGHREREARARVDGADDLRGPVSTGALPDYVKKAAKTSVSDHWRLDGASHADNSLAPFGERARLISFGLGQAVHGSQFFARRVVGTGPGSGS